MARLQILELPVGAGDDRPPFVLVIDEYQPRRYIPGAGQTEQTVDEFDGIAERIGARAVLTFVETVDIPENAAPVAADTYTELAGTTEIAHEYEETRLDLCGALLLPEDATWWKIVETVSERQRKLAGLCRKLDATKDDPADARVYLGDVEVGSVSSTSGEKPDRLTAERDEARIWARHGYEIGQKHCGWSDHGVAPAWLTEDWPNSFDSCEHLKQAAELEKAEDIRKRVAKECKTALLDALGMDHTRDWDDIRNAAAGLRKQRDGQAAAIERVRQLHKPAIHRNEEICWECSAYDFVGQSTDNAPVAYSQCGTLRALAVNGADEPTVKP